LGQDRDQPTGSSGDLGIGVAIGFCIGVATFFLVWRMMVYYLKNKKATSGKDVELKATKYEATPSEAHRAEMPADVSATADEEPLSGGQESKV